MLFHSLEFLIFFVLVYSTYLLLPHRGQNWLLLIASYVFYGAWDWRFLTLMFFSTALDYFCSLKINESQGEKRKRFLWLSVAGNLSVLGFFKYFNFFAGSLQTLLHFFGISSDPFYLNIVLPVGISFYTFQTMSYALDVYYGKLRPTYNLLNFALYVAFFPQLVAGPIERASHLLPQMESSRKVTSELISDGLRLILWGYFKKIVVADRVAIYVDAVYNNVYQHSSFTFILATFFFAIQIYADFSAYSDIARGLAKMLGFDIMVNFRQPYFATSPSDFWRRWHISLSTWLRDYLYIPLGGNRKGRVNTCKNLMVTMLLGGLWHGANWTFVAWGGLHGLYLIAARIQKAPGKIVAGVLTFFLVMLTWVFFRATTIQEAGYIFSSIFTDSPALFTRGVWPDLVSGFLAIAVFLFFEIRHELNQDRVLYFRPVWLRWPAYYSLVFGILLLGVDQGTAFIYFQF